MSVELKPEVIALSETLKKAIKIDPKTGIATPDEGLYTAHLPEDLTESTLKSVAKYNSTFIAASGLALGELALPMMKKDSDLVKVMMVVPTVGGDKVEVDIERSKMTGAPGAERTEKFGHLSAAYVMRGARPVGNLGSVRQHLGNLFTETLSKKK